MTDSQAEKWVVTSALIVAAIYGYRRLTETPGQPPVTLKQVAGVGELPPLGAWATAWGFTFLVIALIATASPEVGASFAVLIAVGDLMTNAQSIFADVGQQQSGAGTAAGLVSAKTVQATQGANLFDTPTGVGIYHPPTNIPGLKVTH